MLALKKAFDLLGVDKVELFTENETLKNRIGSYDEEEFEKPKAKLLKHFIDEKIANLNMAKLEKK